MEDFKYILDLVNQFNTPVLCLIAWLTFRLYQNHLPHILDALNRIDARMAHLEGRQEERDKHDVS